MPLSADEYVQRIGRTVRIGNKGMATSFFDGDRDSGIARDIARVIGLVSYYVTCVCSGK
jgi:probable ATP-dependent RNA helicase DDX4